MKNYVNYNLTKLSYLEQVSLNSKLKDNISKIRPGDLIGILRLDGLDTLISWGTQSYFGHTATVLELDNELYVVESQEKSNYWPKDNIQRTPIYEWFDLAKKADYHVIHIELNDNLNKKFISNQDKAIEFFKKVEGMRYGYNNFLFGWIDTPESNFQSSDSQLVMVFMGILDPFLKYFDFPNVWGFNS